MTLGRTSDKKIKIKTDGGLRAVSCGGCGGCGPCGGCPTILGALPATGNPPVKPTSIAWSASFSLTTQNPACGDNSNLSGTIDQQTIDQQSDGCFCGVGYVFSCYSQWDCVNNECYSNYGSSVGATIVFGKYKVEKHTTPPSACGSFEINTLVPNTSPEAECAYWLVLNGGELFGASGDRSFAWVISSPNLYPIPPDQIIGSHQISCTVHAGENVYEGDNNTMICGFYNSFTRSGSITIS